MHDNEEYVNWYLHDVVIISNYTNTFKRIIEENNVPHYFENWNLILVK